VYLVLETGGSPFFVFLMAKMKKREKTESTMPAHEPGKMTREKEERIIAQVWAIAEPLCADEGMELVYIQFRRESQGRVLRIFIDKAGGITVEDCALVSRQMGDIVDATMEEIGPYSLEVSSPGVNRPLGRIGDYDRFKGHKVHIKTQQPINGRKNYKGMLLGIVNANVGVKCDDEEIHIPLEAISIARLVNFNGEN
jgi:ribosome maturation factor RimP